MKLRSAAARWCALAVLSTGMLAPVALRADDAWPKQYTIGFQKFGTLILLKSRGDLDKRLAAHGVTVKWAEFPSGVQILEAMNGGNVDFGITGETPPVFAQAAPGSQTRYVGYEPSAPSGEAIVVPPNSPLKSLADLKGKRIAVAKGTNSHYLLVRALAKAGLKPDDVNIAYLKPADANAAFVNGDVDAWAIWDYYYAAAQAQSAARVLASGDGLVDNHAFFLASQDEVAKYPEVLKITLEEVSKVDRWTRDHPDQAAALLSQQLGIDASILEVAIRRAGLGPQPLTPEVTAAQQRIADTLFDLKILPSVVVVKQAVAELPGWSGGALAAAH